MVGDGVVTEGIQIFRTVQQNVHQSLKALGGDHDRPGQLLTFAIDLATEDAFAEVTHHLVVAVEAVEGAFERVREGQPTNEITNGDLTIPELGLKIDVSIAFESVKVNLPVGTLNDCVEVVPVVGNFQGISP